MLKIGYKWFEWRFSSNLNVNGFSFFPLLLFALPKNKKRKTKSFCKIVEFRFDKFNELILWRWIWNISLWFTWCHSVRKIWKFKNSKIHHFTSGSHSIFIPHPPNTSKLDEFPESFRCWWTICTYGLSLMSYSILWCGLVMVTIQSVLSYGTCQLKPNKKQNRIFPFKSLKNNNNHSSFRTWGTKIEMHLVFPIKFSLFQLKIVNANTEYFMLWLLPLSAAFLSHLSEYLIP